MALPSASHRGHLTVVNSAQNPDSPVSDSGWMTGKPDVIPDEKFALPVTWVRGIKLRLFAFSSVAASHDSFAIGLRSGRPIFVLPLLRENKTPGCPIQRVLENDFVVVTGTGTARDFIRLLHRRTALKGQRENRFARFAN